MKILAATFSTTCSPRTQSYIPSRVASFPIDASQLLWVGLNMQCILQRAPVWSPACYCATTRMHLAPCLARGFSFVSNLVVLMVLFSLSCLSYCVRALCSCVGVAVAAESYA
eukprot:1536205-Amphidinium_carterae.1